MASVPDPLLRDGLEALASVLPRGYSVALSSLTQTPTKGETWIQIRHKSDQKALCLVIARRRVEPRDLGQLAAYAARTPHPALLVSPYLAPAVRERLRGFGIGHWDLAGNAQIAISAIALVVEQDCTLPSKGGSRIARSLCGEMASRVVRALVDLRPPYALAELAEQSRVETSCASRVVAYLVEAGMLQRKPRGKIEKVDWQEILRRWSLDAPVHSRGDAASFLASRGLPDLLSRLGPSGFLHALTGQVAFAHLADRPTPEKVVMYVEDVPAAASQFGLHPAEDGANVILVKPADRSVFYRSYEKDGLRYVSPSLMAADIDDECTFDLALAWMAQHTMTWQR